MMAIETIVLSVIGWGLSGPIARLANLLVDKFLGKIARPKLEKLHKKLKRIATVAELHGNTRISCPSLKDWIWEFKDALYDAEDVLDGFDYRLLKRKAGQKAASGSGGKKSRTWLRQVSHGIFKKPRLLEMRSFCFSKEVGNLNRVIKKFEELADQITDLFSAVKNDAAQQGVGEWELKKEIPGWRWTTSADTGARIIGREAPAEHIFRLLKNESARSNKNFSVLPIVGAGGVGKTELARFAYNKEGGHFDVQAWICVFRSFDIRRIMIEIIQSFPKKRAKETIESFPTETSSDLHSWGVDKIQKFLIAGLSGQKFLIVLDDVWEESPNPWDTLCASFSSAKPGSKIVVTTQLENLANKVGTEDPIKLDVLGEKTYGELFKDYAFGGKRVRNPVEHRELESIGMQMAEKFGGSPLAASMIGRKLKADMNKDRWNRILREKLGVIDRNEEGGIVSVLELCYQHLPVRLKQCYLSCALFPKNYCFRKEQLPEIWRALGFDPSEKGEDCSGFLDDLASRSFFVTSKRQYREEIKIHAVLHELADLIGDGEFCRLDDEFGALDEDDQIPAKARHLYVTADKFVRSYKKIAERKSLRSLVVDGTLSSADEPAALMAPMKSVLETTTRLRLLVLPSELPGELPEEISKLRHLRYLKLPARKFKKLPRLLGRLYQLRCLELRNGRFLRFPKVMDRKSRMHLIETKIGAVTSGGSSSHRTPPDEMSRPLLASRSPSPPPGSDDERPRRRRRLNYDRIRMTP